MEFGSDEFGAGWSSPVARWAHNPKVAGSNPAPATKLMAISNCQMPISNWQSEIDNRQCLFRGCSSVGRAHGLQPWGQGFESPHLHQDIVDWQLPTADCNHGVVCGVCSRSV